MKTYLSNKNILSIVVSIGYFLLFPVAYQALGIQANTLTVIPIITIALIYGMRVGTCGRTGFFILYLFIRILNQDPDFVFTNALVLALVAGFSGGLFGLLSDQRKALLEI